MGVVGVASRGSMMTYSDWVPWVISLLNCTSIILNGQKKAVGWLVLVVAQIIFVVYGLILTNQTGFLPQAFVGSAAMYNYYLWTHQTKEK